MKNYILFIFILSGCSTPEYESNKFNVNQFEAVARMAMHDFNNTRPVDFEVVQPFRDLEALCANYEFPPQKTKASMMNLLSEAGYEDIKKIVHSPEMDGVLTTNARRNADFAFQVCDNAYRTGHGQEFKPIKLKPSGYYSGADWNK